MDTKTVLTTHISTFMDRWRYYKKGLKGLKFTDWVIASDYCLDDKTKLNDVITFTIFPYVFPKQIIADINKYIPTDIKKMKHIPKETMDYLKNSPYFFSISVILEDKENFVRKEKLSEMVKYLQLVYNNFPKNLKEDHKDNYQKIQKFANYLKQGRCSKKLLATMLFVTQYISMILEFLLIKENGKNPFWCSDRDSIISFNDGIIFNFIQSNTHGLVRDRVEGYKIHSPKYNTREFPFDPLIRIPDMLCGCLSSVKYIDGNFRYDKEKHKDLLLNVIAENPRLVILRAGFDKTGKKTLILSDYYKVLPT